MIKTMDFMIEMRKKWNLSMTEMGIPTTELYIWNVLGETNTF